MQTDTRQLIINEIYFEITQNCTENCRHCKRGPSQYNQMTSYVIQKALEHVKSINMLTFTGGEPSTHPYQLKSILDECKKNGIQVRDFKLTTNGIQISHEFLSVMIQWYLYVKQHNGGSSTRIRMSTDKYHIELDTDREKLTALSFFDPTAETPNPIYNEGNAQINDLYKETYVHDTKFFKLANDSIASNIVIAKTNDHIYVNRPVIYVSATGEVKLDPNQAYANMSNWVGNLNEQSLYEIIEQLYEITNEDEPHERFKELYESCFDKLNKDHIIDIDDKNRLVVNITDEGSEDKVFIQKITDKTNTKQTLLTFDKIYYTERITAQLLALLIYKIRYKPTEKQDVNKITQKDLDEAIGYIQTSNNANPVIKILTQVLANLDNKTNLATITIRSEKSTKPLTIPAVAINEAISYIKHFNTKNIVITLLETIAKQISNDPDINVANVLYTTRS